MYNARIWLKSLIACIYGFNIVYDIDVRYSIKTINCRGIAKLVTVIT